MNAYDFANGASEYRAVARVYRKTFDAGRLWHIERSDNFAICGQRLNGSEARTANVDTVCDSCLTKTTKEN